MCLTCPLPNLTYNQAPASGLYHHAPGIAFEDYKYLYTFHCPGILLNELKDSQG